jgi:integration host factor subunit alpha
MNFIELDDDAEVRQAVEPAEILDTLTKANIASLLYQRMGINKRESRELVEAFFEEIRQALSLGEDVKLSGFGSFEVRKKPSRPGRNPRTGEPAEISARTIVSFVPSAKLKTQVSERRPVTDLLI